MRKIFPLIIAIDQFSKFLILNFLTLGESVPIVENLFYLTYTLNSGMAFGVLANQKKLLLIFSTMFLIFVIVWFYLNVKGNNFKIAVLIILAGATGNLIDRIRLGSVIDFLDFKIWPIFNFADISIVLGTCFGIYNLLKINASKKS